MPANLGRSLGVFGVGLLLGIAGTASSPNSAPGDASSTQTTRSSAPDQELPNITFVFDHPELAPNHFEIVVDRMGKGSYVSHSDPKPEDAENARLKDEDLQRTFLLSRRTLERVFDLAKTARYFDGEFDY